MASIVRPTDRAEAVVRLPADRPPRGRSFAQPPSREEPPPAEAPPATVPAPEPVGAEFTHVSAMAAATLANTEGGSLLERAMQAAQEQAEEQIERLREQARDEGYREGREQGERDGRRAWGEGLASLAAAADGVRQLRDEVLRESEDKLVELVFEALARLLGDALTTREGVAAVVRQVLQAARDQDKVLTIRLAPPDLALLGESSGLPAGIALVPDTRVQMGGCLLDTTQGSIDGRLEIQLERLKDAVLEARHGRGK